MIGKVLHLQNCLAVFSENKFWKLACCDVTRSDSSSIVTEALRQYVVLEALNRGLTVLESEDL